MSAVGKITFGSSQRDFTATLNKRVNDYFKTNQLSKHANGEMILKTILMISLYFVPYAMLISGVVTGVWAALAMVVLMGFGLAGIGLSVMHDGNHGAYSSKKWVNDLMGYMLNVIGASAFNWKVQHNVLHHSYTNVFGADEDIGKEDILRFAPQAKWRPHHKYQYIYAWFLYGLMTISWMFFKDFNQIIKYQKTGMIKQQKSNASAQWAILIATKIGYLGYIFVVPLLLTSWAWWQILIGILIMHYITGFILAIIFQPAHVIEGTSFPQPDQKNSLQDNWAIHQIHTTTDFARDDRVFTWLVGGLNHQVEHHLFPGICHVHYPTIARIVESTAAEFNIPYKKVKTFGDALKGHMKMLKYFGKKPTSMA